MRQPLEYTQHSVAFPSVPLHETWFTDSVSVNLVADGGGTSGEIIWTFMTFSSGRKGVRIHSFGDSLNCLYDERVQQVMADWRAMRDPDSLTPRGLIAVLFSVGAVPSEYHREGEAS